MLTLNTNSSLEITKSMRDYIEDAVRPLEEILPGDSSIKCNCKVTKLDKRFEITIVNKEYTLRAETSCRDFYDAVDKSINKVVLTARKYHHKLLDKKRRKTHNTSLEHGELAKESKKETPIEDLVVRDKEIMTVAMSVENAIFQLEVLDHDFFLFLDKEDLTPCVIYKRNNGGYGILRSKAQ